VLPFLPIFALFLLPWLTGCAPKGERATLSVTVDPVGADVRLDGRYVGRSPFEARPVAPGRHRLDIILAGYYPHSMDLDVRGEARYHAVALPRTGAITPRIWPPPAKLWVDGNPIPFQTNLEFGIGVHELIAWAPWYGLHRKSFSVKADTEQVVPLELPRNPRAADLYVESDPAGAQLVFEGLAWDSAPQWLTGLDPEKSWTFEARLHGFEEERVTVKLLPKEKRVLRFVFRRNVKEPIHLLGIPKNAQLVVERSPTAQVLLARQAAEGEAIFLPPGEYRVGIRAPGYWDRRVALAVKTNTPGSLALDPIPKFSLKEAGTVAGPWKQVRAIAAAEGALFVAGGNLEPVFQMEEGKLTRQFETIAGMVALAAEGGRLWGQGPDGVALLRGAASPLGEGSSNLEGVLAASASGLWMVEGGGRIWLRQSATGRDFWVLPELAGARRRPVQLAADDELSVAADAGARQLWWLSLAGASPSPRTFRPAGLLRPAGIALTPRLVLVVDSESRSLLVFDREGAPLASLAIPGTIGVPGLVAARGPWLWIVFGGREIRRFEMVRQAAP